MTVHVEAVLDDHETRLRGHNRWRFEVAVEEGSSVQDPGPEVIYTDGFWDSWSEAAAAGEAWAKQNGHTTSHKQTL
jgi:hypothetical protein